MESSVLLNKCFYVCNIFYMKYKMATDSLLISVSAKRQSLVLKEKLIICIKNDMLFLDVSTKICATDEENIEVKVQCFTIKSKGK